VRSLNGRASKPSGWACWRATAHRTHQHLRRVLQYRGQRIAALSETTIRATTSAARTTKTLPGIPFVSCRRIWLRLVIRWADLRTAISGRKRRLR